MFFNKSLSGGLPVHFLAANHLFDLEYLIGGSRFDAGLRDAHFLLLH